MGVGHRLSCRLSTVHANVKSLRSELFLKYVLDLPDESEGIGVFLGCHLPKRCDVSLWNYKGMTFRNREAVQKGTRQLGLS